MDDPQSQRSPAGQRASGGGRIASKGRRVGAGSTFGSRSARTNALRGWRASIDALDLRFAVEAEDLSLLKQESRGKLRGQGTLRGTWMDPIVER